MALIRIAFYKIVEQHARLLLCSQRRDLCRFRLVMDPIFEYEHSVGDFHDTVDDRVSELERAFPLVDRYRGALLVGKTIYCIGNNYSFGHAGEPHWNRASAAGLVFYIISE